MEDWTPEANTPGSPALAGQSLVTEDDDDKYYIEHELNSSIFWNDPHEIYSHITTPENILLEYATSAIRQLAPVYQYIDYLNTLGRLLNEDEADGIITQEGDWFNTQAGHFSLERKDYFTDENNEVQVEFDLVDSMGSHVITEDYDHFIVEGDETASPLDRLVTGEPHFKTPLHEIELQEPHLQRLLIKDIEPDDSGVDPNVPIDPTLGTLNEDNFFQVWKDEPIATLPYGLQPFRPHYFSQWASADLGFVDDKFRMEDNTGIILLEHTVTNQDRLLSEDYPGLQGDIMNPQKERLDLVLLEEQPEWLIDGVTTSYLQSEEGESAVINPKLSGVRISHESSRFPIDRHRTEYTPHQSWSVLPAYQYSRIPTRLQGLISIADGGTAVTGSEYCSFTTQLKVGEEFQTEDVRIVAEDSGGDVVLETNERLEHEDVTLADVEVFVLDTARDIELRDFRWLISQENLVIAAHSSHANVQGIYLERKYPGGDETTAWDTNDESFWIPTHETNDRKGITKVVSGSDDGKLRVESLEWENNNMLWEDMSKQLIIEPQAFIVGSITNDASMTVTRKHLGGVTEAEYRL